MSPPRVIIVGGGLAGLAAAEALSRSADGLSIELLEAKRRPGGRAGSYLDPETGAEIDYCQHAAMGCCVNLIDMLRRCRLDRYWKRYRELTFLHPDHPPSRFAPGRWLPAPLHLAGTIDALCYLTGAQKRQVKSGLWKLLRTPSGSLAHTSAVDWLRSAGQSPETIAGFWDVILVSALGEQSSRVSMAAARKVLVDGFAVARGASDVWVPTRPLAELFGRMLTDVLVERGVRVRCGEPVRRIGGDRSVHTGDRIEYADYVIVAVPWHQLTKLLDPADHPRVAEALPLQPIAAIPASPISGIHLWFDRPITSLDHAVMVGTTAQWLFRDPCDADDDGADENDQADAAGRQVYHQVVISASADATSIPKQQLIDVVLRELRHAFPDARDATLLRHRVVTDPNSVFSIRPDVDALRPACRTAADWLLLAGDWTQTGWPATMEGAVISGRVAAEHVLAGLAETLSERSAPGPRITTTDCRLAEQQPGWLARRLIRR
jgi:squalene-associated FAD-dependent desaturase